MKMKFIKGTVLGTIIGAVGGLLMAPKSGKQTRAEIKKGAAKAKKDTEEKLDKIEKQAKAKAKILKSEAKRTKSRLFGKKKEK